MESEGAVTIPQLVECLSQAPPAPAGQRGSNSNVHSTHSRKGSTSAEKIRKDLFTDTYCKVCGAKLLYESQRISHYEGKKHAQKVRIYFQMHPEQEPVEALVKKTKADQLTFQMDGNEVSDENKFCKLCNMVFSSAVVAESHYVGKIHAKKLKNSTGDYTSSRSPFVPAAEPTKEKESIIDTPVADTPSETLFPQPEKPKQDVKIDLHSLSENTIDFNDPDKYCKLCTAQFNNPLMAQDHYVGKRHARNKYRVRMMAEMEEEAVLSDSSKGASPCSFICPICSMTFTSIEMYQSHMQGNKHQTKENLVVNLIKNSKKSYDSFQDELADYIKVQKARGLIPKTNLRKTKEGFESCDYEDNEDEVPPPEDFNPARRAPYERPRIIPSYRSRVVSNRLPYRATNEKNYSRGQYMNNSQYRIKYVPEEQHTQATSLKSNNTVCPKTLDSNKDVLHSSSDDSSGSYHRERRQKRKRRKEKRHRGSEDIKKEEKHVVKKRKMSSEDADSGKEDLNHKEEMDTTNVNTIKHRKEKKCKAEAPADKESKKHKRVKKKKDEDSRTEEEKLWDESILGF